MIFSSFFFSFSSVNASQISPHIVKGCVYINGEVSKAEVLVSIVVNSEEKSAFTFKENNSCFNYNIGFNGFNGQIGYFNIKYKGKNFEPLYNKTVKISEDIELYYIDLHISVNSSILNTPPVADTSGPYTGFVDEQIIFNASKSYDSDGEILEYNWYFDNTFIKTGAIVNKSFNQPGNYTITLSVLDDFNEEDIDITHVSVEEREDQPNGPSDSGDDESEEENQDDEDDGSQVEALLVVVDGSYRGYTEGEQIRFSATITGGTPPYGYKWDFKDGTISDLKNPTHSFYLPGDYQVEFTVTDSTGQKATDSTNVYIDSEEFFSPEIEEDDNEKSERKLDNSTKTKEKDDILKGFSDFFGDIFNFFDTGDQSVKFLPVIVLGAILIISETFLVLFIKKKGFFKL